METSQYDGVIHLEINGFVSFFGNKGVFEPYESRICL